MLDQVKYKITWCRMLRLESQRRNKRDLRVPNPLLGIVVKPCFETARDETGKIPIGFVVTRATL
jgi:hypothetical protein